MGHSCCNSVDSQGQHGWRSQALVCLPEARCGKSSLTFWHSHVHWLTAPCVLSSLGSQRGTKEMLTGPEVLKGVVKGAGFCRWGSA